MWDLLHALRVVGLDLVVAEALHWDANLAADAWCPIRRVDLRKLQSSVHCALLAKGVTVVVITVGHHLLLLWAHGCHLGLQVEIMGLIRLNGQVLLP